MDKDLLQKLYTKDKLSVTEISKRLGCSNHKVDYWISNYKIPKRTISEALYQKNNPLGDPFLFNIPRNIDDMFLFGLGLGLFWGEGTKKSDYSLRLCNSDPFLVKKFIEFLVRIYKIDTNKLRFQLQIYSDLNADKLILFWSRLLKVKKNQFYKSTILQKRGKGTYNKKMEYGTIILCFNNVKLKNLICSQIADMKDM